MHCEQRSCVWKMNKKGCAAEKKTLHAFHTPNLATTLALVAADFPKAQAVVAWLTKDGIDNGVGWQE